jgi:hypothetical protein
VSRPIEQVASVKLHSVVAVSSIACLFASAATAQIPLTPAQLNGDWRGTLVLDNSSPQLVLEFNVTDSTFAGKVYADGDLMGPMEQGSRDGNRVHFKVGRFDFTGVVTGARMKIDLIVYNGSTRTFTATKVSGGPSGRSGQPTKVVAAAASRFSRPSGHPPTRPPLSPV